MADSLATLDSRAKSGIVFCIDRCYSMYNSFMIEKAHSDAYIAGTHAITAGLAIPIMIDIAYAFVLAPLIGIDKTSITSNFVDIIVNLMALWIGVKYSVSNIHKTCIVNNWRRIANLSTLYLFLLLLIPLAASSYVGAGMLKGSLFDWLSATAAIVVFYYTSSKELPL